MRVDVGSQSGLRLSRVSAEFGAIIEGDCRQRLGDLDLRFVWTTFSERGVIAFRRLQATTDEFMRFSGGLTENLSAYQSGASDRVL